MISRPFTRELFSDFTGGYRIGVNERIIFYRIHPGQIQMLHFHKPQLAQYPTMKSSILFLKYIQFREQIPR